MANIFQPNSSSSSSSSGTGKNYLSTYNNNTGNGDFENGGTTGWSLAHSSLTSAFPSTVGTAANAFSSAGGAHGGSAANGNLSITASNASPIAGTYSGSYASAAASTAGDMLISDAFTIDTEDQAKVLTFKFYYSATSNPSNGNWSGTSSNSFGVAIYDVTNALWIMPAGVWGMTQSTLAGYVTGTFQSTSNSTQYQLAVFNANASAGAITVKFDDFSLGPQTSPVGSAISDWTAFTPTGAWSTNTTYTGWWRRNGDSMSMIVKIALAGAPTSASLTVNLPTGITLDTTKLPATPTNQSIGKVSGQGAAHTFSGIVLYSSTTAVGIFYTLDGNTASIMSYAAVTQAAPYTFANNDFIYIYVDSIPVSGWSSSMALSNDTDTRVVAARMTGATATITGSYSDITWTTIANDTHASMGAISYTVPVTGYYDIMGAIDVGATSLSAAGGFFIGLNTGSVILENKFIFDLNVPENESLDFNYGSVFLNSGATFKLQVKTTGTVGTPVINSSATTNFLSIKRISGPAVVASTESVNARYFASATSLSGSLATISWTTKDYDSHNAMSSGTYTIPVSGKYQVNTTLNIAIGGAASAYAYDMQIQKNGSLVSRFNVAQPSSTNNSAQPILADIISCVAGDTVRVQVSCGGNTPSITSSNFLNYFSIARVGN